MGNLIDIGSRMLGRRVLGLVGGDVTLGSTEVDETNSVSSLN